MGSTRPVDGHASTTVMKACDLHGLQWMVSRFLPSKNMAAVCMKVGKSLLAKELSHGIQYLEQLIKSV